jgi:DNA gyrase subunit A
VYKHATLLTVSSCGYGKRSEIDEYRVQSRGGKGVITMRTTEKTGEVIGVRRVTDEDHLMLVTDGGKIIRLRVSELRIIGRNTQGVRLLNLGPNERVASLALLAEKEDEVGEEEAAITISESHVVEAEESNHLGEKEDV